MLIKQAILERIARGDVDLAFRRWKRPTVKVGGTLLTSVGQLKFTKVEAIDASRLNTREARRAGFEDLAALQKQIAKAPNETLYRIALKLVGPDPRIALRENDVLSDDDLATVRAALARLDRSSNDGPWTGEMLELIRRSSSPGAAELARLSGRDKEWLKLHIRKLKNLGLVLTRCPGYQLSPRGSIVVMRGL